MRKYEENWVLIKKGGDISEIVKHFGITPAFARILWGRGYQTVDAVAEYLYPEAKDDAQIPILSGRERFYRLLCRIREERKRVRVVGDYDVDGVTATYLALDGLRTFGVEADYRIPDRVTDGYGISDAIVEECARDGIEVLLTVDNGIAACKQIERAKAQGMLVIVTDHHEPQGALPPADLIVDPKWSLECESNCNLCGAGIIALLMDDILAREGKPGFRNARCEILALATVCDVMPMNGDNRRMVRLAMKKSLQEWNLGLRTLVTTCGISGPIRTHHFGFWLGPCINALGRMETADFGVELLLTSDALKAKEYCDRMVAVNELRKEQTEKALGDAYAYAENREEYEESVLVIPLPDCHESLAGIIAGRVRDRYHRPTILLTPALAEKGLWKGSGRSIEAYNLFDGLHVCESLLMRFGGHAMAAGVTVSEENIEKLREQMNKHFRMCGAETTKKIAVELMMSFSNLSIPFVDELAYMEPYGPENARSILGARRCKIVQMSYFGRKAKYLKLVLEDTDGVRMNALCFKDSEGFVEEYVEAFGEHAKEEAFAGRGENCMHIIFTPDKNEYRGRTEIQLLLERYQWVYE